MNVMIKQGIEGGKSYFCIVSLIMILMACVACATGETVNTAETSQTGQASDNISQNAATGSSVVTTPLTPASASPPTSVVQTIPETPMTSTPIQTVTPPPATIPNIPVPEMENLIRTEACKMVLTLDDMGDGWVKGNAVPPSRGEVISSCSVHYYKGSSFSPVLQNTVAVYRSIDYASRAFAREETSQTVVTHPGYGDECFMNDSVAINKLLVFRKDNVVVWIWLQNDKKGNIESYARIIEQKITL